MSSVTSLLPMSADDTALTMAQRIGKHTAVFLLIQYFPFHRQPDLFAFILFCLPVRKVGIPIVLSVNLPTNSSSLQLAAERQIVEELQKLYPCRETRLN